MRNARTLLLWLLAGVAGLILFIWAYPRDFPFLPPVWSVSQEEAVAIALERFQDLGEPVKDPYVVARLVREFVVERRLQLAADRQGIEKLRDTGLLRRALCWEVVVFPPGAQIGEWTYLAYVSPSGEVFGLRMRLDPR